MSAAGPTKQKNNPLLQKPTFSICHVNGDVNRWSFRTKKAGAYAEFGRNLNEPLYEELRPSSAWVRRQHGMVMKYHSIRKHESTAENRVNTYLCCTYAGQIQLSSYQTSKLVPPQTWTIRLTASMPRPQESKYTSPLSPNNRRAVQCEAKITSGSQLWNTHTHMIPWVCDNDALLLKIWQ